MPNFVQSQIDTSPLFVSGIHVAKTAATLPQSGTQHLFTVSGGHVLITMIFGRVTVAIQNSDPVAKLTSTPTVGTAVDIDSTVDLTSLEVGGMIGCAGDGTALIKNNAGASLIGAKDGAFIVPPGSIDLITGASKSGATKWDLWYIPLDDGAFIVSA